MVSGSGTGEQHGMCLFDVSKAFDTLPHTSLPAPSLTAIRSHSEVECLQDKGNDSVEEAVSPCSK